MVLLEGLTGWLFLISEVPLYERLCGSYTSAELQAFEGQSPIPIRSEVLRSGAPTSVIWGRCSANSEQIQQSGPYSGLGLSPFLGKGLFHFLSCPPPVHQQMPLIIPCELRDRRPLAGARYNFP